MAWNSPGQSRTDQNSTEQPKLYPKSPKVLQKGTQKSLKNVQKPSQNATLDRVWEMIANSRYFSCFLVSFLVPFWSHFCTFGSHLPTKWCLETNLFFDAVFCCFFDNFWRVQTRISYGIYQSKHVFALLGKVTLFVGFWPRFGSLF